MYEHLQLYSRVARDLLDVREAQLARQHDAIRTHGGGEFHGCRVSAGHLRRGVNSEIWGNLTHQSQRAEVLHDQRVDAGALGRAHHFRPGIELRVEDQRVQGEVRFHAPLMETSDRLRQAFDAEILGACPCVECVDAEVYCVRASADRRLEGELVASGG